MAVPTNVQAAITAADAALADADAKAAALASATAAVAQAQAAEAQAQHDSDAAVKSLADAKAGLTTAIDGWLVATPATSPNQATPADQTSATPPLAGQTVVTANATGKPGPS